MKHLPDLPTAGFSTFREKQLSDAMMFFLRMIERDRQTLLMMVIEGWDVFRPRMLKEFAPWKASEDEVREVFRYLTMLAGPDPIGQFGQLLEKNIVDRKKWTEEQLAHIGRYGRLPEVKA